LLGVFDWLFSFFSFSGVLVLLSLSSVSLNVAAKEKRAEKKKQPKRVGIFRNCEGEEREEKEKRRVYVSPR
jgi:hypothetical protein